MSDIFDVSGIYTVYFIHLYLHQCIYSSVKLIVSDVHANANEKYFCV